MAGKNTLRARLELLGGKEIVGQFAAIEKSAKKGFDTIEREAKEATRDVKELERELAKLEAMSKSIRASIKVKKGGSLTADQQQALALAKQLDNRAASMRQQIQAANDSLKMGGGNALRTLAGSADKDLLGVAKSAAEIDDAVASLRKNGGLGGLISDDQIDKMSAISDALNNENVRYGDNLQNRVSRADATDIEKERRRAENERKDDERFAKRQKAISDAKARERTADDEREKERQRIREEKQAEHLKKLDDKLTQQRIANEHHLARIKAENRRREAASAQRDLDRRQAQARIMLARQIEQDQVARRNARQSSIDLPPDLQVQRDARLKIEAKRHAAKVKDAMEIMSPGEIENLKKSESVIRKWINSAEGLGKVGHGFKATGKLITGTAGDIARSLGGNVGSISKFVSALEGLSTAVGSAALRTGIAGLLAALAGGLAALGGGAVLAGIAAVAGLAGWDATKIANSAKSVGTSLETFSTMRYGAQASGVEFDDYSSAMEALRGTMVGSITPDKETGKSANGVLMDNAFGKIMASDDGGATLRDTADVLKDIADVYNRLGTQDLKNAFLDTFGGQANELRAMIPFLEKGSAGMSELQKEARRLGVELDSKLVADMEVLNREVFKLWNVFRGIGYSIAKEVLPVLKPVMDAINGYLIENRDNIAQGVVGAWNYLIQTIKDFWKLWNTGGEGGVVQEWTKTVFNGVQRVGDIFGWMWDQIKKGYALAEPTLTMISDYFGLDGPLEVALILAAGWALGFFGVFTKGGKVVAAGVGVALSAIDTLLSPLKRIMGLALGVVGWPLLLGAGLIGVYSYWDEIEQIFTAAWSKFKETFPQTAAVLEKVFGPALVAVRKFWTDYNGAFREAWPETHALLEQLKENVRGIGDVLNELAKMLTGSDFDWSVLTRGLSDGVIMTLNGLLGILRALGTSVGYLLSLTGLIDAPAEMNESGLSRSAEEKMDPKGYAAYEKMLNEGGRDTETQRLRKSLQGNPAWDRQKEAAALAQMQSYVPPSSQVSGAAGASAGTPGGATGETTIFQFNEGEQVTVVIPEAGGKNKLISALSNTGRARIVK
jgi:hypothetical protein